MDAFTPGIGHNGPPLPLSPPPAWFEGASARICRRSHSVTSSASRRRKPWVLCFERRTPPVLDPLMGWTGGDDTFAQVRLEFERLEDAIRYAEAQGLAYRVEGEAVASSDEERRQVDSRALAEELYSVATTLASLDPTYGTAAVGRRPDLDRAIINPAAVFSSPQEVVHDPTLSVDDKREVLRRWAWDAWLLEVAADEAMGAGEPSRLEEVKAAMLALDRLTDTAILVSRRINPEPASDNRTGR